MSVFYIAGALALTGSLSMVGHVLDSETSQGNKWMGRQKAFGMALTVGYAGYSFTFYLLNQLVHFVDKLFLFLVVFALALFASALAFTVKQQGQLTNAKIVVQLKVTLWELHFGVIFSGTFKKTWSDRLVC